MGWGKMNKPGPPALRRSGNGGRHLACGGSEKGWRPQREEKREEDALGRKRKERDKVYHLIERFGLRSELNHSFISPLPSFFMAIPMKPLFLCSGSERD